LLNHYQKVVVMKTQSVFVFLLSFALLAPTQGQNSEQQLANWLKRFPAADTNGDGKLTSEEAAAFRPTLQTQQRRAGNQPRGVTREFSVNPGWQADRFPDHAISHLAAEKIAELYAAQIGMETGAVVSYEKPSDGSLRIVRTGHSFMAPGYKTLPLITRAAGLNQPRPLTHTGGGMTGSTRYLWEKENGIFQFDKKPTPKLLASISNAQWDAMTWGPYFNDRPAYYSCWIDFCLKTNPDMKFYLSDAWPQLDQLEQLPSSADELTSKVFARLGD